MSRMRWPVFLAFNVLGALLWTVVYCALGYFFGQSWELLHKWIGRAGLFGLALVVVLALLAVLQRYRTTIAAQLDRVRGLLVPALSLGALGVFAKIAEDVQEHETSSFDRAVSLGLHRLDSPVMDVAMRAFTFLGSLPFLSAVVVGVAIWRVRRKDKLGAIMLVGVTLVTELLNLALKEAFQRSRPSLFEEVATLHSYSFPSGHSMAAAAVYGAVAVLVARACPPWERLALTSATAVVVLIGVSRIFLGVHWVTDVLAGWAGGAFVVLVGTYLLEKAEARV